MGKFSAYKVQLASLPIGKQQQEFVCDTQFFKNMENDDVVNADVAVHLDLENRNGLYDLKFTLKGLVQVPCDRCLDPIDIDVDTTYNIKVEYGDSYDDASDDLLIIPTDNPYLNVAYMLYDTILLSIPMRHVHPLGKCNRAMAAALSRHRVQGDEEDEEEMVDTTIGLDAAEDIADEQ